MPLDQGSLEKKDELYKPELETPSSFEIPKRRLEIVPPPKREGETGSDEELRNKEKAVEEHANAAQSKPEFYETPKTIEQLGAELLEIVDNVPEGGNIDLEQVEKKCVAIVSAIVASGDKSPEKIKDELIIFAEKYFKNYSSLGFIITELFRIADKKIGNPGY